MVEERLAKLAQFAGETELNKIELNDKKIGIITSGISYQYVKEAFPQASVLKLVCLSPVRRSYPGICQRIEHLLLLKTGALL